ncbi:MAG TPA: type II secretion system F family protein [Rhizomicrobium sp.]|nr:type II secretion system F family protein [Rhizomicrobium sp.]
MGSALLILVAMFGLLGMGGIAYAFVGGGGETSKKRLAAAAGQPSASGGPRGGADSNQQRRKNVQTLLKELEKQQAANKQKPTLRRRIEQAGLSWTVRNFWIGSGVAAAIVLVVGLVTKQAIIADVLGMVVVGLGLPRWVLNFLKNRRQKKFTSEFANAIDAIVRSVRSGIPTNEALKMVAKELPEPVSGEFSKLVEGLRVGVTLEQGLKRMYESMPTAEVAFFGIVMTIQQKSGGNLSEALSNLSGVLRDRKRLQGKIKAMSSEAKASAGIIGSLPVVVGGLVYMTTPDYIKLLFTEKLGNLMLVACAFWMACGIFVMKKMISFKY